MPILLGFELETGFDYIDCDEKTSFESISCEILLKQRRRILFRFFLFQVDMIGSGLELTAVVPDDTFTVTQAVNALGFGKFQILVKIMFSFINWPPLSLSIKCEIKLQGGRVYTGSNFAIRHRMRFCVFMTK